MGKHRSFTVQYKLSALKWMRDNKSSITKTAKEFNVDRKRIREWRDQENKLEMHSHGAAAKLRRISQGVDVISPDVESGVLDYLLSQRIRGIPVSNADLQEKALSISRGLDDRTDRLENFKASSGWLRRWKKRNRVAILRGTSEAQKVPADYGDQIKAFVDRVNAQRIRHQYTLYNIANMDQTMCRFDMAPKSTNNVINQRSVRIATTGGSKRGFTVALCASASGHKKKAYICFKERNGVIPPRVFATLRIPANVIVTASINGWMTGEKMEHWINRVWGDNNDDVQRLLILDRARIHTMNATQQLFEAVDTDVEFIPAGCTPICQPADVSWNAPFKSTLRKEWKSWRNNDGTRTAAGNLKMASRQEVILWVSRAWDSVTENTIKHSFKCTGLSSSLQGGEYCMLSDDMIEALHQAFQNEDLQHEAAAHIFESDSENSDLDFEGFSESEI